MNYATKEISKELYDQSMANNGFIPDDKYVETFGVSLTYGYGVYYPKVHTKDGKYYVTYSFGSSCD